MQQRQCLIKLALPILYILLMVPGVHTVSAAPPAATSASYQLFRDAITSAGKISSASYTMTGIAGEPSPSTSSSSASYAVRSGYKIANVSETPTVTFTTASQSGAENAGTMTITAQLSGTSSADVDVPFTLSGTATDGGTDYSITASPITIPAGATTQAITITVTDDALDETDETVIVTMGSPTNATQGVITVHTATITDNDDDQAALAIPTLSEWGMIFLVALLLIVGIPALRKLRMQ